MFRHISFLAKVSVTQASRLFRDHLAAAGHRRKNASFTTDRHVVSVKSVTKASVTPWQPEVASEKWVFHDQLANCCLKMLAVTG